MARPGMLTPVEAPVSRSTEEQARVTDLVETGTPALVLGALSHRTQGDFAARSRWAQSLNGYIPATVEPCDLVSTLEELPLERAVLTPAATRGARR